MQAGIAQLVEHNLAKVGVASSNLVSRSIFPSNGLTGKYHRQRMTVSLGPVIGVFLLFQPEYLQGRIA